MKKKKKTGERLHRLGQLKTNSARAEIWALTKIAHLRRRREQISAGVMPKEIFIGDAYNCLFWLSGCE